MLAPTHAASHNPDGKVSSITAINSATVNQNTFVEVDDIESDLKYTLIRTTSGNDPDTSDRYLGLPPLPADAPTNLVSPGG